MNFQTAFAGPPLACGDTLFVDTALTADLNCTDVTGGLTIGAIDVELDLNGWNLNCTGAGYLGSCQGTGTIGVDQNGQTGMTVTGPSSINGFEVGVLVDATGANVKDLLITGPADPDPAPNPRPSAQGILVTSIECPDDFDTTVNIHGNEIENHREGVALFSANCVNIHQNVIHANNSDPVECSGILLVNSDNNKIHANTVFDNGENAGADGGILLYSSDTNKIFRNDVSNNNGAGISLRSGSTGNAVDHNQVTGHTLFGGDLSELGGSPLGNTYLKNCYVTTDVVPAPTVANKCPIPNAGA
jgi:parallel beta-helix repeat protein